MDRPHNATCRTCRNFDTVLLRGQWVKVCLKTGQPAPMVACALYFSKWAPKTKPMRLAA
jgi:hypothetical protein